jgi:hypothetical protein
MDDTQRTKGHTSQPEINFILYLAATIVAIAWPRLTHDAGIFAWLGRDATAILWVPFALWAAAEAVLLAVPHLRALDSDARRLAAARLVSGIRLLARCAVWILPVIAVLGANPLGWWDRATGSLLNLAMTLVGVAVVVEFMPSAAHNLGRLNPPPATPEPNPTSVKSTKSSAGASSVAPGPVAATMSSAGASSVAPGPVAATMSEELYQTLVQIFVTGMRAALRFFARWGLVAIRVAVRWTRFGVAALSPRLGSDPLATLNTAAAATARFGPAAGADAGAKTALSGTGSLLERAIAALLSGSDSDAAMPIIYGPAAIWTAWSTTKGAPVLTMRAPLKASFWRNDPASAELVELGSAILEASHADALQHGNSSSMQGGAGGAKENEPATEIGKRLILRRAWARPDYFAFILSTAPVVSNDILGRLTTDNLAANVAAHSRFTRSQVLAWLHTEHDPDDRRTEVVVDDPARAGVVGTFMVFDRGEARISDPPSFGPSDADDEEDPFARSPF